MEKQIPVTNNTPIFQVDAFTDQAFAGNPAAICLLSGKTDTAWMQTVAAEMNLSETAFVTPLESGFELRWFTPVTEVELCGHATLAAAHLLWEQAVTTDTEIYFHTRSGVLAALRNKRCIELDFPATPATPAPCPEGLSSALGTEATEVLRNQYDYLLRVESESTVREMKPDFTRLQTIDTRGVIVTAPADGSDCHFVSRFFAPRAGINEDPVTGSAHCTLAPYWENILKNNKLTAFQASERGGTVHMELRDDRVILGGTAITVLTGTLTPAASRP